MYKKYRQKGNIMVVLNGDSLRKYIEQSGIASYKKKMIEDILYVNLVKEKKYMQLRYLMRI